MHQLQPFNLIITKFKLKTAKLFFLKKYLSLYQIRNFDKAMHTYIWNQVSDIFLFISTQVNSNGLTFILLKQGLRLESCKWRKSIYFPFSFPSPSPSPQNHQKTANLPMWLCYVCVALAFCVPFRVCLVGVKIIFVENDFLILRCLAKKKRKIIFRGK